MSKPYNYKREHEEKSVTSIKKQWKKPEIISGSDIGFFGIGASAGPYDTPS